MARQWTDYRPLIESRLEDSTNLSMVVDRSRKSTAEILDQVEKIPFGQNLYAVAIGDRRVTPQTSAVGYRKGYIEYDLVLLNKSTQTDLEALVDTVYQSIDRAGFPSGGIDTAITTRVLFTEPTQRVNDTVPIYATVMTIEIVAYDSDIAPPE